MMENLVVEVVRGMVLLVMDDQIKGVQMGVMVIVEKVDNLVVC